MDAKKSFDFAAYVEGMTGANRLARANRFTFCTCSGINYLEELLQNYQSVRNFVAVSDLCDESVMQVGGGWMKRRLFTVFVLARAPYGDMRAQKEAMSLCRELYRQMLSRLLRDEADLRNDLIYLNLQDVRSSELGGSFLNGCTGLYFMLTMDEPTDISFNGEEWG